MRKPWQVIREKFEADPPLWAIRLMVGRLLLELKGSMLGVALSSPKLCLGPGSVVIGARYISFGSRVRAKSSLRLDAMPRGHDKTFKPLLTIEEGVAFSDGVHISSGEHVRVGSNTLMGSHIYISDYNYGTTDGSQPGLCRQAPVRREPDGGGPVIIGQNVWIGDNVIILGPANIGDGAIIGANSVVRGDIPAATMAAGTPAAIFKQFRPATGRWERV